MSDLPHLTWLRAFEAAARHASFTAAASELGLTPAAISQQIKLLEQHLGAQLFTRLPRGVALTDTGHAYAQPVRKAMSDMQAATHSLFARQKQRILRLRASISYGALVLAPELHLFHQAHPDIRVELTTAVWTDRIEDEAIDVEIRYGHGDWQEGDIRHLGHRHADLVCHPDLARRLGPHADLTDFVPHAVQVIGSEMDWGQMAERHGLDLPAMPHSIHVDSSLLALQILTAGTGAAILSEEFSCRLVKRGALVSPLPYRLPLTRSFFLVVRENTHNQTDIELFSTWLLNRQGNGNQASAASQP